MKYLQTLFILSFLCFFSTGCSDRHLQQKAETKEWSNDNGKIKVLSTTAMVNDLVKAVGGEFVDVQILIKGDLDPHSYQLVKGDDEKLASASIIFYNGLGLEHGPSLYHYLHENEKAVSLGDSIAEKNKDAVIYVNNQTDPHIWTDIALFAKSVPFIVQALAKQDPSHAAIYQDNADELVRKMLATHEEVKALMHTVPATKRYLVTSHDAFNYFTRAYLSEESELAANEWKNRFAAPEGLAPESQLSATDIRMIIDHIKKYQIHSLFPESNVSRDSIKKIVQAAREEGFDVRVACCPLYGDAMGQPGSEGDTYLKMILYNAKTLALHMDPQAENQTTWIEWHEGEIDAISKNQLTDAQNEKAA